MEGYRFVGSERCDRAFVVINRSVSGGKTMTGAVIDLLSICMDRIAGEIHGVVESQWC